MEQTHLKGGAGLKKLMILVAMMAMGLLVVAPAIAQVGQEGEQEGESGEVDQSFDVSGTGSNGNSCAPLQGSAQSGNSQNQIDGVQDTSTSDDFEFDETGSDISSSGSNSTECIQTVQQAASAAAAPKATPPPPPAPKAAPAPPPAPKAAPAPPPAPKAAPPPPPPPPPPAPAKELPKTGGIGTAASLFALGAGALLVAGGLLARRLAR